MKIGNQKIENQKKLRISNNQESKRDQSKKKENLTKLLPDRHEIIGPSLRGSMELKLEYLHTFEQTNPKSKTRKSKVKESENRKSKK